MTTRVRLLRIVIIGLAILLAVIGVCCAIRASHIGNVSGDQERRRLTLLYLQGIVAVIGAQAAVVYVVKHVSVENRLRASRLAGVVFIWSIIGFVICAFVMTMLKVVGLHMYADLANNLEILWRVTHGRGLTSPMFAEAHHGMHWFAAHFAPIAYLIAFPWFKLFPHAATLATVQVLAVAAAAIAVGRYAAEVLRDKLGFLFGAAFLIYPTADFVAIHDFGFLQLCMPFLAWAFYSLHRGWLMRYALFIVLALLCREEVGLTVGALGVFIAIGRRQWWIGAVTATTGLAYSIIAIQVIIPSLRDGGGQLFVGHYSQFGGSLPQAVANMCLHPLATLKFLIEPSRIGNAAMYLLPLGGLSLLAPVAFIPAIPALATSFLSNDVANYSYIMYYAAPAIPFVFFSAIEGAKTISGKVGTLSAMSFVAASAFTCMACFGPTPLSLTFWFREYKLGAFYTKNYHYSEYQVTKHATAAARVAALVPMNAVISAEQHLLPLLFDREAVRIFPTGIDQATYVLIDKTNKLKTGFQDSFYTFRENPDQFYRIVEDDSAQWILVAEQDGVRLFRRRGLPESSAAVTRSEGR